MNIGHKTLAALALGIGLSGMASAQNHDLKLTATLSYGQSEKQTWNTVLLISAAVLVVGLIQNEDTLTLLGGAGVLVSLVQTSKYGYMPQAFPHGIDLVQKGPLSLGMNPFGLVGPSQGFTNLRPSVYVAMNFKF